MKAFLAKLKLFFTKKVVIICLASALGVAAVVTGVVLLVNSGNDKKPNGDVPSSECEHVAGEWVIEKEASCTVGGKRIKKCDVCGEVLANEIIPVSDHTPSDWIVDTPATVDTVGKKHTECTVCYAVISEEEIPKIDGSHQCTAGDWVEVKATSCKEAGAEVKNCTVCGSELDRRPIEKLEHTPSDWIIDKEATATENGTRHKECTVCEEKLEEESYALPHEHVAGDWQTIDRATCSSKGKDVQYCTICEQEINSRETEKNANAHTPKSPAKENEVAATCKAGGSYDLVVRCEDCNAELSKEAKTTEKTAHNPGEPTRENEVAATCAAAGSYDEVIKCSVCDEQLSKTTKAIGKIPHTPGEPVEENKKEATCQAAGSYDEVIKCTACGEELAKTSKTIAKRQHTPAAAVEENKTEATCAREGSYDEVIYCKVCSGEVSRTTKAIGKVAHTEGEWAVFKRATCTDNGEEIKSCTVCNQELDRRETDPIPHVESGEIVDVPADIGVTGKWHVECTICGTQIREGDLPALEDVCEHVAGNWTVTKAASCTEKGIEVKNCTNCGTKLDERDIAITDHEPGTPVRENEVDSTCSTPGSYEEVIKCVDCQEEISRNTKTIEEKPHTPGEQITDTDPTCAVEGTWHKSCTVCGDTVASGTVPTLDEHTPNTPVQENIKDSTCDEAGSYDAVTYCSVCNKELSREKKEIDKKGHTPSAWKTDKEATCKEEGSRHIDCTVCGEELQREEIGKLTTHTPGSTVKEKEIEATCTAGGSYDEVVYCTICENEISRVSKTTVKAPHTESTDFRIDPGKDSTCTATGTKYTYCTVCESKMTEHTIEKKPHTPKAAVEENRIEATCSAKGSYDEVVYCSVCDGEISRDKKTLDIVPTAHTAGEWETTSDATCTVDGTQIKKCIYCQATVENGTIPANGHLDKVPVEENRVEPTCTVTGSYELVTYCQICNAETKRETKSIPATDHSYGDWTVKTAPTESAAGQLIRACDNDKSHTETKALKALSTSNGYTYAVVLEPSCTTGGKGRFTIVVDGQTFTFDVDIAKASHTVVNGAAEDVHKKCSVCGETVEGADKHTYTKTTAIAANCTTKGSTKYTCSCGYTYTLQDIAINASNHTGSVVNGASKDVHTKYNCCGATVSSTHSYAKSTSIEATCTTKGTSLYTCGCGYSYTAQDIAINASNHTGSSTNGGTQAVHTKYSCCGATISSTHSYTKTTVTAATCTKDGTAKNTCSCGYSYNEAIPKGHKSSDWITTVEATCVSSGTRIKKCTVCGTQLASETIASGGHTASAAKQDPAAPNYVYTECTKCGEVLSKTFQAPATSGTTNVYENDYTSVAKPTLNDYKNGVLFNWNTDGNTANGWTVDFSAQSGNVNIAKRDYINSTDLAKINEVPELADAERFLVIEKGADGQNGAWRMDIFDSTTFVVGYTYYLTFEYYATDPGGTDGFLLEATNDSGYWTGAGITNTMFRHTTAGYYSVTVPFTVAGGTNALGNAFDRIGMFFYNFTGTFYIASVRVEYTDGNGPTLGQMMSPDGYDWDMTKLAIGETVYTTVGALTDASAKSAFTTAGYASTAPVVITKGGNLNYFSSPAFFNPKYEYTITLKYYTSTGGGYFIGLESNGPGGNHLVKHPLLDGGYHSDVFYYRPGALGYDEYGVTFFNLPADLQIVGMNFKVRERSASEIAMSAKPSNTLTLTQSQIASGYTFDFSAGNIPALSGAKVGDMPLSHYVDSSKLSSMGEQAKVKEIMSSANGFNQYGYFVNKTDISFDFTAGALAAGSYEIEIYAYLAEGGSFNGIAVLPMNSSGTQQGSPLHFDCIKLDGHDNLYKLKLTGDGNIDIGSGVHYFQTYWGSDTEIYYISSIYIKKVA